MVDQAAGPVGTPGRPSAISDFRPLFAHLRKSEPDTTATRVRLPPSVVRRLEAEDPEWRAALERIAGGFGFTSLSIEVPEPVAGTPVQALADQDATADDWAAVTLRLTRCRTTTISLGQCEHGWVARAKVPKGRAHVSIESHGEATRYAAVVLLADLAEGAWDGSPGVRTVKAKPKRRKRR